MNDKTVTVDFSPDELQILNDVMLDRCMTMVDVVNRQKEGAGLQKLMQFAKVSVGTQQRIFKNAATGSNEWPENMLQFIKGVVEESLKGVTELKELAFRNGLEDAVTLSTVHFCMTGILAKIPEPSRIIV